MSTFPIKKSFEKDFINIKWKILFTLRYDQASLFEYYEFISKSHEEQTQELLNILYKNIKFKGFDRIRKSFNPFYETKLEKSINVAEILNDIMKNRYRVSKSIFEGLRSKKNSKWAIESVWLANICQKYNISPTDLMQNYTLEQYFWLLDWIERISNSMSKEWEAINMTAIIDKESIKKRAEETKAKFLKFKK